MNKCQKYKLYCISISEQFKLRLKMTVAIIQFIVTHMQLLKFPKKDK